jgi:hypothetical protein
MLCERDFEEDTKLRRQERIQGRSILKVRPIFGSHGTWISPEAPNLSLPKVTG